eukprot:498964_1
MGTCISGNKRALSMQCLHHYQRSSSSWSDDCDDDKKLLELRYKRLLEYKESADYAPNDSNLDEDDMMIDIIGMSHVIRLKYEQVSKQIRKMNYWDKAVGEHCNNLIPDSLKKDLISACDSLRIDKSKLNYRNRDLTNLDGTEHMQIQDLIEPCNPTKAQLTSQPTQSANTSETEIPPWIPTVFKHNQNTNVFEI